MSAAPPGEEEVVVVRLAEAGEERLGECQEEVASHILWRSARPGQLLTAPCPAGAGGQAARECREGGPGGWGVTMMGDCRSVWVSQVSHQYRAGRSMLSITQDIINTINRYPVRPRLSGKEINVYLKLVGRVSLFLSDI